MGLKVKVTHSRLYFYLLCICIESLRATPYCRTCSAGSNPCYATTQLAHTPYHFHLSIYSLMTFIHAYAWMLPTRNTNLVPALVVVRLRTFDTFLPRDAVVVCLCRYWIKTAKLGVFQKPHYRPGTLVFWYHRYLRNSNVVSTNGGDKFTRGRP